MILLTVTFTTKEDFLKVAKARKDVRITDIACCDPPRIEFGAQPTFGELMAENTLGEDVDMYDFDIDPDDAEAFLGLEEVVNEAECWVPIFRTDPPLGNEPQTWGPVPNFPEKPKDWPTRATTGEVLIKHEYDDGDDSSEAPEEEKGIKWERNEPHSRIIDEMWMSQLPVKRDGAEYSAVINVYHDDIDVNLYSWDGERSEYLFYECGFKSVYEAKLWCEICAERLVEAIAAKGDLDKIYGDLRKEFELAKEGKE